MAMIDLSAEDLFGNEAAEDEELDVFLSHHLERDDFSSFESAANPIKILMAYKGQGKSSMLRALANRLKSKSDCFVVKTTGSSVFPEVSGYDPAKWAKAWKKELYGLIAVSLGTEVGIPWSGDSSSLIEEAEKGGFRKKSILKYIAERLSVNAGVGVAGVANVEVSYSAGSNSLSGGLEGKVGRYLKDAEFNLWLIIDDIDRNFRTTKADKAKIVGFFDAIRDMRNCMPSLRVRTSIRPNVYTSVRLEFESISHIRQYLMRLDWTEDQLRGLLARRVEGYILRTKQGASVEVDKFTPVDQRDIYFIGQIFDTPVRWGEDSRPVHIPLITLSAGRPRWLIELCKRAAIAAFSRNSSKIFMEDVRKEMVDFGEARRSDIVAEFGAKCEQLSDLIDAFYSQKSVYETAEILELIERKILSVFSPNIAGLSGRATANDVANFLFEVGLFNGRREFSGGKYEHVAFPARPSAFTSLIGVEPSMKWEIHPVFRTALAVRS